MDDGSSTWTDFADLLLSPVAGAVLGWLWWTAMPKYEIGVPGFTMRCVDVLGSTICNPWSASGVGAIIAFLIAGAIHAGRS